jgi:alpha-D-ribose 1-methylphosphonate 5-triphosphate synthase subunit PhnH
LRDYETPVWLDRALARRELIEWIHFHTGAPVTSDSRAAAFAFVADGRDAPSLDSFGYGTTEYPDRSTTLVLQVETLSAGEHLVLSGPGIAGSKTFAAAPLPRDFGAQLVANREAFPRGIDMILATDHAITALPRTVRVIE